MSEPHRKAKDFEEEFDLTGWEAQFFLSQLGMKTSITMVPLYKICQHPACDRRDRPKMLTDKIERKIKRELKSATIAKQRKDGG